jgi:hypothetical protein
MEAMRQMIVVFKKNECAYILKELKRLYNELSSNYGMLKGALGKGCGDK